VEPAPVEEEIVQTLISEGQIDLTQHTPETLISAVQFATRVQKNLHIVVGALAAEMVRRGMKYREIGEMVGHPYPTVWRWAKPFLTGGDTHA
jgi:hypothetical protein